MTELGSEARSSMPGAPVHRMSFSADSAAPIAAAQQRNELLGHLLTADWPEALASAAGHNDHEPFASIRFGFHGFFTASRSGFTNSLTRLIKSGLFPCRATWSTMALPTTTASALPATIFACSGVEMPNPTAIGRHVWARIFAVICVMVSATLVCMPVTPSRET